MKEIFFTKQDRIAIIAPHPDDECLGAFAPLQFAPEKTDVIVVSDGSHGNKNVDIEEEALIRQKQFNKEMEEVNPAKYIWLGFEDTKLSLHSELLDNIDLTKYTIIFLPWQDSLHPDHRAVFNAVIKQVQIQHCNASLFSYEIYAPFRLPTHYMDITDFIDKKRHLINIHQDQISSFCQDEITITLNKFRACQNNLPKKFFECYVNVKNPNE